MNSLTLVTGSAHKLAEWKRLVPADWQFTSHRLDLEEIQSLDTKKIVTAKVKQAYKIIKKPVVVEDVSAGLDKLQGLPGPFIKFFEEQLGSNALYILAGQPCAATVLCTIGYYDGHSLVFGTGEVHGTVVAPRGDTGNFGFDQVFVPDGQTSTLAELLPAGKDAISHRRLAIDDLLGQLKELKSSAT